MILLILSLVWFLIFGAITATLAEKRGHNAGIWFIFGGLAFIIALPVLLATPARASNRKIPCRVCPYCSTELYRGEQSCPKCGRSQPKTATSSVSSWEQTVANDDIEKWNRQGSK